MYTYILRSNVRTPLKELCLKDRLFSLRNAKYCEPVVKRSKKRKNKRKAFKKYD